MTKLPRPVIAVHIVILNVGPEFKGKRCQHQEKRVDQRLHQIDDIETKKITKVKKQPEYNRRKCQKDRGYAKDEFFTGEKLRAGIYIAGYQIKT